MLCSAVQIAQTGRNRAGEGVAPRSELHFLVLDAPRAGRRRPRADGAPQAGPLAQAALDGSDCGGLIGSGGQALPERRRAEGRVRVPDVAEGDELRRDARARPQRLRVGLWVMVRFKLGIEF